MPVDFPSKPPTWQRSLRPCKHAPHHSKWIVALYGDSGFELAVCVLNNRSRLTVMERTVEDCYDEFWTTIKNLSLSRGKWWLVGWASRLGLENAGLLRALERGEIHLPLGKGEFNRDKPAGKVTLSQTTVEIDLKVGRHAIKVIDFSQLGLTLDQLGLTAGRLTLEESIEMLAELLTACSVAGLSVSKTTAAQMGWARYRAKHLPDTICVNLDSEARALERRAHYPGRNEVYQLGDIGEKVYSVDVKSCYAYICSTFDLPVYCLREYPLGVPVTEVNVLGFDHWIADCIISTTKPDYPLRWGEQVVYPTGEFHTSLAWPELCHALLRGRVKKITRAAQYAAKPAMRSYAEWFQQAKRKLTMEGYEAMCPTLKSVFNASLGYSARRLYEWQQWEVKPPWEWWIGVTQAPDHSEPVVQARVLGGVPEWLSVSGEPYESLPYLHATICSWARVHLLSILEMSGRGNVLYCDTDGLLLTAGGMEALGTAEHLIGSLPGQLVQRFRPGRCRIGGLKNYRVGNSFVCAGGIETRRSLMAGAIVLDTPGGRCDTHGKVSPFAFTCSDEGDGKARYVNRMAGV